MASAAVVERPAQTVDKARAPRPRALTSDVVIVGCGVAGLYSALNLPRALRVTMICKEDLESCDSMLAQGGICVMRDRDDYDSWFDDTMRAGHGECRAQSVDTMIWSSRDVIADLVHLGVEFDRTPDGGYDYTREGAHSRPRILHHADVTGKEITTKLLAQVRLLPNVEIREHVCMDDLLVEGGSCVGVVAHDAHDRRLELRARDVILATGGVGGLYERSTNFPCLTGDGCRVAAAHGVTLDHMDYVQIHPTSLYTEKPGRAFLISESCRGEGAILLNAAGERFCDELSSSRVTWSRRRYTTRWSARGRATCACRSNACRRASSAATLPTSGSAAWRRATTFVVSPSPWCPRSTTSWAASTWALTPRPACRTCMRPARQAATACTSLGWPHATS